MHDGKQRFDKFCMKFGLNHLTRFLKAITRKNIWFCLFDLSTKGFYALSTGNSWFVFVCVAVVTMNDGIIRWRIIKSLILGEYSQVTCYKFYVQKHVLFHACLKP